MAAPTRAEPLPPPGFSEDQVAAGFVAALGPELGVRAFGWLTSEWRSWAREMASRADDARRWCAERAK